jgi:pyrimidine oxygenase
MGSGINTPMAIQESNERLVVASKKAERDCGAYVLFTVIADETDELTKQNGTAIKPVRMSMP